MTWSHFIFLPAVWFSLHIFGQKRATSRSPRRNLDNSVCKTMEWEAKPKLCLNSQQLHNKVWFRQHTKASHTQGDAFLFFLSSRRRAFSYANMLCFDDRFDVGSEKMRCCVRVRTIESEKSEFLNAYVRRSIGFVLLFSSQLDGIVVAGFSLANTCVVIWCERDVVGMMKEKI